MSRRTKNPIASLSDVGDARSDYRMANRQVVQARKRAGVPYQGAGADYHYRRESDYLWMGSLAWDLYNNNMALGSITDRAIENWLQGGFSYNAQTGDSKADTDIEQWWQEVSQQPDEIDYLQEDDFATLTQKVALAATVPGDILGLPISADSASDGDGTVQLIESHLCRDPSRVSQIREHVVNGVERDERTKRIQNYWFLRDKIDPNSRSFAKSDFYQVPRRDDAGEQNVFHVAVTKRTRQSRGVSAYAPIIDPASYHDDVQFLKMVQARAASLFVFVRKRAANFDPAYLAAAASQTLGRDVTEDKAAGYEQNARQYREVAAGSALEGLPGEEINPWSANIPNPEFFPHAKMLLTFMGINLGMPLVMALMDASETNFSGYRGAVDQARMGFRARQRFLIRTWHRPFIRFKLRKQAERDPVWRKRLERSGNPNSKFNLFGGRWDPPGWPYIEPTKDAAADVLRVANGLASLRRVFAERGLEYAREMQEGVDDIASLLRAAVAAAVQLKQEFPGELDTVPTYTLAMQMAKLPNAERFQISISADATETTPADNNSPEPPPDAE